MARNQPADAATEALKAELKEQKASDTIEVAAADAPNSPVSDAADDVAALQAERDALLAELAAANAELAKARSTTPGTVELDLETDKPRWVLQVSGMERKDIAGYVVVPANEPSQSVLIVKDKDGREGHRFTFDNRLRTA